MGELLRVGIYFMLRCSFAAHAVHVKYTFRVQPALETEADRRPKWAVRCSGNGGFKRRRFGVGAVRLKEVPMSVPQL